MGSLDLLGASWSSTGRTNDPVPGGELRADVAACFVVAFSGPIDARMASGAPDAFTRAPGGRAWSSGSRVAATGEPVAPGTGTSLTVALISPVESRGYAYRPLADIWTFV
jgi:hypothetical protein